MPTTDPHPADATDPVGSFVDRFERPDPDLVYLDGNSLGRPPAAARAAVLDALDDWAHRLVGAWDDWIDLALTVGDEVAPIIGARPGRVVVGDSTTVCLYRAIVAACKARPHRNTIVGWADDFPTDRYVIDGIAASLGHTVRWIDRGDDPTRLIDDDVAVVAGSIVDFATAAIVPIADLTAAAQHVGALTCWDLSHAAGAIPLGLDGLGVDFAVGCTYKYLHGGPGAPAFTYVGDLSIDQPIHGWFGQHDQFAMAAAYDPMPGVGSWRAGTPGILGLVAARCGISIVAEAGMEAVRRRSMDLGEHVVERWQRDLEPLGIGCVSPLDSAERGGHVSLSHPEASRIVRACRAQDVIADFRGPDLVRLGPGPLATSFAELDRGLDVLTEVVASKQYLSLPADPGRVT